jgi:hypothetical protein
MSERRRSGVTVTGRWRRVWINGRRLATRSPLSPASTVLGFHPRAVDDLLDSAARVWKKIFGGILLGWFRWHQQLYVLRSEVRSLCGRMDILRARKVLEFGLPISQEPSLCENPCSCTCHSDRTPYIRRLYQFHASASLGDLLILEEVLKTAEKLDDCNSCSDRCSRDA